MTPKIVPILLTSAALLAAGSVAIAKEQGSGKSDKGEMHAAKAHKHHHNNGHNLLGAKLKQDGKHEVGKLANRAVSAEVKNGKVTNMSAGDLPMKRVKSKQKMAHAESGIILASAGGEFQIAQGDAYYYGYCFDDGSGDYECYWYPAEDVDYADYSWDDYDPNY